MERTRGLRVRVSGVESILKLEQAAENGYSGLAGSLRIMPAASPGLQVSMHLFFNDAYREDTNATGHQQDTDGTQSRQDANRKPISLA